MAVDDSIEIDPQDIVTTHTGDGTHVTHMSAVSFATGSTDELRQQQERQTNVFGAEVTSCARPTPGEGGSIATGNTERTAGGTRKVHRDDVRQIFHASTTRGTLSWEQLERIAAMHNKIADGVSMDFNYCVLLMVASIVAALGLATDSSTTVISSMLLSPIMGPVIGMAYGLCVWDLPLIKRSMRNEIVSITVCVAFGVLIGLCTYWTKMAQEWPTEEMTSRGTRTTFLCGFPIAFFSGLGVALSILDDQTSSLVGVAISASLLPPAVNCGMLFIVAGLKGENFSDFSMAFEPRNPELFDNLLQVMDDYFPNFSQMGFISLMLTVINVIMVACGSALMFRVKEVLPIKKKVFWDDLKFARRLYQGRTIDPTTGETLTLDDLVAAYLEREGLNQKDVMRSNDDEVVSKQDSAEAVSKHASVEH